MLRIILALAFLFAATTLTQAKPAEEWRPWFYQEPMPQALQKPIQTVKDKKAARTQKTRKSSVEPRKAKQKPVAKKPHQNVRSAALSPVKSPQGEPKEPSPKADSLPVPKVLEGPSFDPFGNIIDGFKKFLEQTSQFIQGNTMQIQGMEKSLGWLEPKFRENLAKAIYQARREGFNKIGVFSAYRQPNLGIGGFGNKFLSCHSYGLAADMSGIGGPGSKQAIRWHQIAKAHGVHGVYGPHHGVEWNHMQAVPQHVCGAYAGLRNTITGAGPKDPEKMWAAAKNLAKESPRKKKTRVASRH